MKQTVRHYLMPDVCRMEAVVKELVFDHYPARVRLFIKLLYHAVARADHRQIVLRSHHAKPLLQIPVVCKHRKQQDDSGPVLCGENPSDKRFIADPFRLIPLVVHRKLHDHNVRRHRTVSAHIALVADHAKLRGRSAHARLDIMNILVHTLSRKAAEPFKSLPRITFRVDGHGACALCD